MGEGFFNLSRIVWLMGVALLVLIENVAISVLYMVVYSYAINPGHDAQYYNDHVQAAAPYCSTVAGIPLMFIAGWLASRWWRGEFAVKSALFVWFVYAVIDLGIVVSVAGSTLTSKDVILVAISLITKLAAVYAGALAGSRRTS